MSFDLEMNTSGRINLAGLVLNYTVQRNGDVVIPGGSHAGGIALVENLSGALTRAGLVVANPTETATPAPAKATVTATPAPETKPAKARPGRKPAPKKDPEPVPAVNAAPAASADPVKKRGPGRPPKSAAAVA